MRYLWSRDRLDCPTHVCPTTHLPDNVCPTTHWPDNTIARHIFPIFARQHVSNFRAYRETSALVHAGTQCAFLFIDALAVSTSSFAVSGAWLSLIHTMTLCAIWH